MNNSKLTFGTPLHRHIIMIACGISVWQRVKSQAEPKKIYKSEEENSRELAYGIGVIIVVLFSTLIHKAASSLIHLFLHSLARLLALSSKCINISVVCFFRLLLQIYRHKKNRSKIDRIECQANEKWKNKRKESDREQTRARKPKLTMPNKWKTQRQRSFSRESISIIWEREGERGKKPHEYKRNERVRTRTFTHKTICKHFRAFCFASVARTRTRFSLYQ